MGEHIDRVIADLLETDALTPRREPSDGVYIVHEDDLEHLVRNVIDIDRDLSAAEKSPTWADVAQELALSSPLTFLEALDLVKPFDGIVAPGDAVHLLIAGVTSQGRDGHSLAALLLQAAVMHSRPDPKVMIDPEAAGAVCHSDMVVGECSWLWCPQTRDGGPTDRHCPLDRVDTAD